jgi:hydroxymethylpyrimidine/phosphomethylpyrimidine kinase
VTPPRLLTIAGSDSGGGAGIQADLKTFAAHGGYGMSVITAVTAQNTRGVRAVHAIPAAVVVEQLRAVLDDIGADAIKIGMLASAELVAAVAGELAPRLASGDGPPVVLDPVMVAQSGDPLLADDAVAAIADLLLPCATLATPNLPEAARLTGLPVVSEAERLAAARRLAERSGGRKPGGAGVAVLIKGGHGEGAEVIDLLLDGAGATHRFAAPRIETGSTHGTGCTLSSAIAARLAVGETLPAAVGGAIDYLRGALAAAYPLGGGHGPVDHLYRGCGLPVTAAHPLTPRFGGERQPRDD